MSWRGRASRLLDLSGPSIDPVSRLRLTLSGDAYAFLESVAESEAHMVLRPKTPAMAAYLVLRVVGRLGRGEPDEDAKVPPELQRYVAAVAGQNPELSRLQRLLEYMQFPLPDSMPLVRVGLISYAELLEREGRFAHALAVVEICCHTYARRMPPREFVPAALLLARLRRRLAQWDDAGLAYGAAREVATQLGAADHELRADNGMIMVLLGRGDLPAASALAEAAIARTTDPSLNSVLAITYDMLGTVRDRQGRKEDAVVALYRAIALQENPEERLHEIGDLGCYLARLGMTQAARDAFELVRRRSRLWATRTNASIELMGLEAAEGHQLGFRMLLRELIGLRPQMPPSMEVDFLVQMAAGVRHLIGGVPAKELLREAQGLADRHRLAQWSFRIEELLRSVLEPQEPRPAKVSEISPAVAEVVEELRVLAEAT